MGQYIEVDLLEDTTVTDVITQGRRDGDQWVTAYKVAYFESGESEMKYVLDGSGSIKVCY